MRKNGPHQAISRASKACGSIAMIVAVASIFGASATVASEQKKDGAEIFGPGVFSTGKEFGVTFSPDGKTIYFTRGNEIYWAKKVAGGWSDPKRASFSDGAWSHRYHKPGGEIEYFNWDPVIAPDGSRLLIMSHGLVEGKIVEGEDGDWDLWALPRKGEGFDDDVWGEPEHLGARVNTPQTREGAAGIAADGDLYYFSVDRKDGKGLADVYMAPYANGEYGPATNLGVPINSGLWEGHTYIEPAAAKFLLYIIVSREENGREDSYGNCDIYVSVRLDEGWGEPVNLGPNVNTEVCELTPLLTPDGKTLFFARIEESGRNIYSIPVERTALPQALR